MAPRQTITPEISEQASASLAALAERDPPQKKRLTASDFVREHAAEIKALYKKGYTASDVAESLTKSGIRITSSTLQRALSGTTQKKRKMKRISAHTETQSNPTTEEHNAARAAHTTTRRTDPKKFVDDDIPEDL